MVLPFYPYKESRVITNKSGDITNKDGDEFSLKNGPAKHCDFSSKTCLRQ